MPLRFAIVQGAKATEHRVCQRESPMARERRKKPRYQSSLGGFTVWPRLPQTHHTASNQHFPLPNHFIFLFTLLTPSPGSRRQSTRSHLENMKQQPAGYKRVSYPKIGGRTITRDFIMWKTKGFRCIMLFRVSVHCVRSC